MLNIVADITSYIIIFVESICAITLFESMFPRKNILCKGSIQCVMEIVILTLAISLPVRLNINKIAESLLVLLIYVLITLFFYRTSLITRIGVSLIFYMTLTVVDYFTFIAIRIYLSLPGSIVLNNPLLFFIATAISKTILFMVIIVFRLIIKKGSSFEYISKCYWLIYIVQSIITMIALLSISDLSINTPHISHSVVIASIGLLFLNIAVFGLLEWAARFGKNVRENALIKQQIEIELDNMKSLSQVFDVQREYIHDYKHNLNTIYQLLCTEKYAEVLKYVKSLSEDFYYVFYRIKTDHSIIDAILNQKDFQAKRNNVILDIRAGDLSKITISDDLLVTILANVLDNAIEACNHIKMNKIIHVKIVDEDGILIFSVINPVLKKVKIVDNMVETTKEDRSCHGIGLKNVATALSKCNGDYEIYCNDDTFQFTAFIRLSA
ncbi:sensor histidine kinase [Anaerocolumna jejuensis]|uniref:sensor histidine kinase n=1 Tax=Anaerocolumna jejuensis TaxID=259063 RepID=UPI003F7CB374